MAIPSVVGTLAWARGRPAKGTDGAAAGRGSLFFLDLGDGAFAVTAEHVVRSYLAWKSAGGGGGCTMDGLAVVPEERLIARDPELDVATFRVGRAELVRIGKTPYACPPALWPPHPPAPGEVVALTDGRAGAGETGGAVALIRALVTDVNERHVVCTFDRSEAAVRSRLPEQPEAPLLRGTSGAPLWLGPAVGRAHRRPVGVVKKCMEGYRVLVANRLDVIEPDGTFVRRGW